MTPEIMEWLRTNAAPHVKQDASVLEVGSLNVNGRARDAFGPTRWYGIDGQPGPDVDFVGSFVDVVTEKLHLANDSVDVVVACESLEHDPKPWRTVEEMRRILRPEGLMIITTPGYLCHYHGYPKDYYRFSEDTYREVWFEGMEIICLETIGPAHWPTVCGIARKK